MSHQLEMEGGGLRSPRPSILALDMSLVATGVCLNGEPSVIRASHLSGYDRLSFIAHSIFRLTFGVDVVVMEAMPVHMDPRYSGKVAERNELAGIIKFWLYEHELTTVLVNVATLKKFATGTGQAGKPQMLLAAQHRFHLGEQHFDDNEVDAYLLWAAAREAYGGPIAKVPAVQAACVHSMNWPKPARRDAA